MDSKEDLLFSTYDFVLAEHSKLMSIRNLPTLFRSLQKAIEEGKFANPSEIVVFVHGHYCDRDPDEAFRPIQLYLEPAIYSHDGQIVSQERFEQLCELGLKFTVKDQVEALDGVGRK